MAPQRAGKQAMAFSKAVYVAANVVTPVEERPIPGRDLSFF